MDTVKMVFRFRKCIVMNNAALFPINYAILTLCVHKTNFLKEINELHIKGQLAILTLVQIQPDVGTGLLITRFLYSPALI